MVAQLQTIATGQTMSSRQAPSMMRSASGHGAAATISIDGPRPARKASGPAASIRNSARRPRPGSARCPSRALFAALSRSARCGDFRPPFAIHQYEDDCRHHDQHGADRRAAVKAGCLCPEGIRRPRSGPRRVRTSRMTFAATPGQKQQHDAGQRDRRGKKQRAAIDELCVPHRSEARLRLASIVRSAPNQHQCVAGAR